MGTGGEFGGAGARPIERGGIAPGGGSALGGGNAPAGGLAPGGGGGAMTPPGGGGGIAPGGGGGGAIAPPGGGGGIIADWCGRICAIEPVVVAVETALVWPSRSATKLCKHFGHLICSPPGGILLSLIL